MGPRCLCLLPPSEAGAPVKPCLDSSSGRVSISTIKESRSPGLVTAGPRIKAELQMVRKKDSVTLDQSTVS